MTVTQTLAGLDDVAAGGYEPPDVQVAAGPGYVVEAVNLAVRVWRTGGGPARLVQTRDLAVLFGSGGDSLTDPRLLFDAPSGRWLASISDLDTSAVLLAVSSDADPTGTWTVSALPAAGCADQPRLGVADAVVVLAADIYGDCDSAGSAAVGSQLWTVSKAQLLAGSTAPAFTTTGLLGGYSSLAPVQSLSPAATEYVVSVDERASLVVHLLAVDGVPPGPVRVREVATPSIAPLLRPPPAAQPPAPLRPPLSTNDIRVLDSVWENGRLWLSANSRCLPPGDRFLRSCARIVELSTDTGAVTLDTDLSQTGAYLFYPALRPDGAGNLVVVAGESGVKMPPQLVVFGLTGDGALTQPAVVARSAGTFQGDRYGDYFGASRDPGQPGVVWVAGEAGADNPSGVGWSTAVASVVVTAAGGTPPLVAGAAPPGVRAVGSSGRAGRAVRLAYTALGDGAGVRTAVTVRDARSALLYSGTTAPAALAAGRRYSVAWPGRHAPGTFSFCVAAVAASGLRSPQSCASVTLRR